ncbi:MAG: HIT family protein [candidate division WOR-3 bacterium]|nr:MAG: HIT family protein [candidate division WOR-3 bacterium]
MKDCPFCRIVAGEAPARRIHEDETTLALLDIHPVSPGHTLVVTKRHIPLLTDVEPSSFAETAAPFFKTVYAIARKMKKALGCSHVSLLLRGKRVPHIHMHLIPGYDDKQSLFDLTLKLTDYCQPRLKPELGDKELDSIAERIKSAPVQ